MKHQLELAHRSGEYGLDMYFCNRCKRFIGSKEAVDKLPVDSCVGYVKIKKRNKKDNKIIKKYYASKKYLRTKKKR